MITDHHGSLFRVKFLLLSLLKKYSMRDAVLKAAFLPYLCLSCVTLLEKIKLVPLSLDKAVCLQEPEH